MKIDLGSFAFGFSFDSSAGNPSWGTSFGQGQPQYYLKEAGCNRVIVGMTYNMVPLSDVAMSLGKGGHFDTCDKLGMVQMASLFTNVVVNGESIGYPFILTSIKEESRSHTGRRSLKYSEKSSYKNGTYLNSTFIKKVREKFGLSDSACWFVYDIDVDLAKQEELRLKACFVDKQKSIHYKDAKERKKEWLELIKRAEGAGWCEGDDDTQLVINCNSYQDNLSIDQLVEELLLMLADDQTKSSAYRILGLKYPKSLANVRREDLLRKAGCSENYEVEIHKGIKLHELIAAKKWGLSFGDDKAQLPEPPQNVDKLAIALKLFREQREAQLKYDEYAQQAREMFSDVDGDKLNSIDWNEFCNKHFNGSQSSAHFRRYDDATKKEFGDWLKNVRENAQDIVHELDRVPKLDGLNSFGTTICMFLMKANPKAFCSFAEQGFNSLVFLGLETEKTFPEVSVESYYHNKESQTQVLSAMAKLKIGNEDGGEADYLTVNEFLWFVHDNEDLIKEKVMEKKMKNDKPTEYTEKRKELKFNPESKDDELLLRLLASLRAKPFAILAGHSGTGKSRYVKKLAYMTCNKTELRVEGKLPGNYLLLQVKPNWHDSTDLLGFRNAMDDSTYQKTALIEFLFRAYHFNDTPFFLCLDEMNLAPVEQYFAEFLSAMESKEPVPLNDISANEENLYELGCEWTDAMEYVRKNGFSIPKNLFIVGTVNMDETTNQFSRKVLDRAFTIEMTDVDFAKFGSVTEPSYLDTIEDTGIKALLDGDFTALKLDDEDTKEDSSLVKVQKVLEPTAFAIAYRFASEYTLLKKALEVFDPNKTMKLDALDQSVLMKILPRIAGEADYIRKIYGENDDQGLRKALEGKTASLSKIKEILDRAKNTGAQYITFWP